MESIDQNYNRLFKLTVLSVLIAVMIIAAKTKPVNAGNIEMVQTECCNA